MIDPVCAVLADAPGVGSAYLSVMIVNGDARSYLLVLDGPKDEKLFASVAQPPARTCSAVRRRWI